MTKKSKTINLYKNKEVSLVYEILTAPIKHTCRTKFMQICHLCDDMVCCDNSNPLVAKIKELENKLKNAVPIKKS
jgi:hypothetical protein